MGPRTFHFPGAFPAPEPLRPRHLRSCIAHLATPPEMHPTPPIPATFSPKVPSQLPAAPAVHLNTGRKRRPEHDVEAAFVASGLFAMLSEIVYAAIPYKCWSDTPGPKV